MTADNPGNTGGSRDADAPLDRVDAANAVIPFGTASGDASIVVVTGTGTEIGKTVTTAALAATALRAGRSVAVLKPAQTGVGHGEPGDVAEVIRLAGPLTGSELARFPEPLAPATAALRAGLPTVSPHHVADAARELAAHHDLVLIEGAGGLLVRYDPAGATLADAAALLDASVLVVTTAGLGTLNTTELTVLELHRRELRLLGVLIGSWPHLPDLATRCNLDDLPNNCGAPLLGAIPQNAAALPPADFRSQAAHWLAPALGGDWSAREFTELMAPEPLRERIATAP